MRKNIIPSLRSPKRLSQNGLAIMISSTCGTTTERWVSIKLPIWDVSPKSSEVLIGYIPVVLRAGLILEPYLFHFVQQFILINSYAI